MKLPKSDVEFIQKLPVSRLATVTEKCKPVARPVWHVFDGNHIYVASDPEKPKLKHIMKNPEVSITFDDYDHEKWENLRGISICGKASTIWSGTEYRHAHNLLKEKYPEYRTDEGGWKEGEIPIIRIIPYNYWKWGSGEWR